MSNRAQKMPGVVGGVTVDGRVNGRRHHGADFDAGAFQVEAQRFGETAHAELRGDVRGLVRGGELAEA